MAEIKQSPSSFLEFSAKRNQDKLASKSPAKTVDIDLNELRNIGPQKTVDIDLEELRSVGKNPEEISLTSESIPTDVQAKMLGLEIPEVSPRVKGIAGSLQRQFQEGLTPKSVFNFAKQLVQPKTLTTIESIREGGVQTAPETVAQVGGQLAIAGADFAFDKVADFVGKVAPEDLKSALSVVGGEIAQTEAGQGALDAIQGGFERYEQFRENNPRAAANVEAVLGLGEIFGAGELANITKNLARRSPNLSKLIKQSPEEARNIIDGFRATKELLEIPEDQKIKELDRRGKKILETIAPRETRKVQETAFGQIRTETPERGPISEFLFGKKRGKIIPSEKEQRAVRVIQDSIKNPNFKNPQNLFSDVSEVGAMKAKSLEPKLKKIKLSDRNKQEVSSVASELKDNLLNNRQISDFLTGKEKKNLSNLIDDISNAKNVDEIWKSRIQFDQFTPNSVKQSLPGADARVAFRKEQWLDNRREINDIIDRVAKESGLEDVLEDFRDMSSLFDARQNMISRAPEFLKGSKGIVNVKNAAAALASILGIKFIAN